MKDLVKAVKGASKQVTEATKATIKVRTLYASRDGYKPLMKDKSVFRAYTIAALVAANYLSLTRTGLVSNAKRKEPGNHALWAMIVGPSATNYWTNKKQWVNKDGTLTPAGKNEIVKSLAGNTALNTRAEMVARVAELMETGGKATIEGKKGKMDVILDSPVSAS